MITFSITGSEWFEHSAIGHREFGEYLGSPTTSAINLYYMVGLTPIQAINAELAMVKSANQLCPLLYLLPNDKPVAGSFTPPFYSPNAIARRRELIYDNPTTSDRLSPVRITFDKHDVSLQVEVNLVFRPSVNRSTSVLKLLAWRLGNLLEWALKYGEQTQFTSTKPFSSETYDKITLKVEPAFPLHPPKPIPAEAPLRPTSSCTAQRSIMDVQMRAELRKNMRIVSWRDGRNDH